MPVHDWTLVDAGTFHAFHVAWVTHLSEALNGGLLPSGYYAMPEQHGGKLVADVLTLQMPPAPSPLRPSRPTAEGGVAVAEAPPRVRQVLSLASAYRRMRRTLAIRHVSGHRIVALVEIVSPGNKDRLTHIEEFVDKVQAALEREIHVVVVDLFPPGANDPQGMHAVISERFTDELYSLPPGEPLTLASYVGDSTPQAYLEHLAIGTPLVEMPLFLDLDRYINLPLETTYMAAYQGMPEFWREVLEGKRELPG